VGKIREAKLEMEVSICEREKGEVLGEEEGIIDDFLNYWRNANQQENVKSYVVEFNNFDVIIGYAEDEKYFEVVKSMEEYFSKDKNSEVKSDGECLVNEESNELL